MASADYSMKAADYLAGITLTVRITGRGVASARLWIAQIVMRLAGRIAWTNIEIDIKE